MLNTKLEGSVVTIIAPDYPVTHSETKMILFGSSLHYRLVTEPFQSTGDASFRPIAYSSF
ncbi:MAG TPA: hypothetical protein VJI68_01470 [Candidatus Nanoarchaeia archaeon]|nr:hypothetical protein [Candidatus Nanoarchaeia archaeon]